MPKLLLPSTGNTDANSTAGGGRSGPAPHWPGPLDEERPGACAAGPSTPWLPPRSDRLSCSPTPSPRVRPGACRRPVAAALAEACRSNGQQRARWTGVHGFLQPASGPNCTVQIRSHAPTRRSSGGLGKKGADHAIGRSRSDRKADLAVELRISSVGWIGQVRTRSWQDHQTVRFVGARCAL